MYKNLRYDLPASIVVFFVALPLCLGIALASGAPLFSGIVAGIVGGIVVGLLSSSPLGVSGPAAGLAVIVFGAIQMLGSWPAFLSCVVLAGIFQLFMGYLRAGFIAYFFPSSVIKGMLGGIGLLIILKQLPIAFGYHQGALSNLGFFQPDGKITFAAIPKAFSVIDPTALLICGISILILILWELVLAPKHRVFQIIQGPLVVVILGIVLNSLFKVTTLHLGLSSDHLVSLPVIKSFHDFIRQFTLPDLGALLQWKVWKFSLVIAIVASLETLLSVEATEKLDPFKRVISTNRELKAQGVGNVVSGLCGGLPVTQVVIRSGANISFGARTKLSTIMHGVFLLISAITLTQLLNKIPLASLSAILIVVAYSLTKPALYRQMFHLGAEQFVPFSVTIAGIVATDLLTGIALGMACSLIFTLHHSYRNAYSMKDVVTVESGHEIHHMVLAEEVSFFNKASILKALEAVPPHAIVVIDCSRVKSLSYDVVEMIQNYRSSAGLKDITVETINFNEPPNGQVHA